MVSVLSAVFSTLALFSNGFPGQGSLILMLIAATISGVYLADVKPAVSSESGNPGYW